jgi:protein-tyrosine phosphatase
VSYVELHFHLLPGIDDGPATIDESLVLARAAVADGTRTVVATPHVHPEFVLNPGQIAPQVDDLNHRLAAERIPLDVLPGGELGHEMVGWLSNQQLELIAQGLPGRRWLLLEAPLEGLVPRFTRAADTLRERGFAVTVAHPERSARSSTDAGLEHELAAGSALQLTAGSLVGAFGEPVRVLALELLSSAPRVVIASDAHGGERMPTLRRALDVLAALSESDPERFVSAIPRELLGLGAFAE